YLAACRCRRGGITARLTTTPTITPRATSMMRSSRRGCWPSNPLPSTKMAVVAMATPSSLIQVIRAPSRPTRSASAKVHTLTPSQAPIMKDRRTPTVEATVVCMPRDSDRCTVACTVSRAVHGARNGSWESRMYIDSHQAVVPAITPLATWMRSVTTSGSARVDSRARRVRRMGSSSLGRTGGRVIGSSGADAQDIRPVHPGPAGRSPFTRTSPLPRLAHMTGQRDLAHRLLTAHGRTFAADAEITPRDKPAPLWQLLVLSLLLSTRISSDIAVATARELFSAGWRTPGHLRESTWQERVDALGRGGYRRYDERTATRLDDAAALLLDRWKGDLRRLR